MLISCAPTYVEMGRGHCSLASFPQIHNLSLSIKQIEIEGHFTNTWPVFCKNIKVMKDRKDCGTVIDYRRIRKDDDYNVLSWQKTLPGVISGSGNIWDGQGFGEKTFLQNAHFTDKHISLLSHLFCPPCFLSFPSQLHPTSGNSLTLVTELIPPD